MAHYDARKAVHDPNPLPRPTARPASVRLDVDRLAARAAAALRSYPGDRTMLERVYVDRLLDHLEERHEPAEVDAAVDRFVQELRVRLTGGAGEG